MPGPAIHRPAIRRLPAFVVLGIFVATGAASRAHAAGVPAAAATRPAEKEAPQRQATTIPFTPWHNHGGPIIEVRFDDRVTGHFLLDTGASLSTMSESFARKLGLRGKDATYFGESGGAVLMDSDSGQISQFVEVHSMVLGNLDLGKEQFILLRHTDMLDRGEEPIDGLIGGPMIAGSALLIDYPRRTLTFLYPGGLTADELDQIGMSGTSRVEFHRQGETKDVPLTGQDQWMTRLTLKSPAGETTQEVAIDTGAGGTTISQRAAMKLGLISEGKLRIATPGSGSSYMSRGTVPELHVGDLTVHDVHVEYPGSAGAPEIPALLGENVLSCCTALFDFPKRVLFLKPVLPPVAETGTASAEVATPPADRARLCAAAELPPIPYSASLARSSSSKADADAVDEQQEDGGRALDEDDGSDADRIAVLQKHLKNGGTDAPLWVALGRLYRAQKDEPKATDAYRHAADLYRQQLATKPDDIATLTRLAVALIGADQEDEAQRTAAHATEVQANHPGAWIALGWATHAQSLRALTGSARTVTASADDDHEFRALIVRLNASRPTDAQIDHAQALEREARRCFDRAVDLAPNSGKAHAERAAFLEDDALGIQATRKALQGKLESLSAEVTTPEIVADLDAAAAHSEDDVSLLRRAAAEAAYAPLFRNQRGIDLRGGAYWRSLPSKARTSAQEKLDRLAALAKSDRPRTAARALEALGILQYDVVEDYPAAEKTLRQDVAADADRSEAAFTLVHLLWEQRRYDDAASFLTDRLKSRDCAMDRLLLARTLERLGRLDEAREQARQAATLSANSATARLVEAALALRSAGASTGNDSLIREAGACLDRLNTASAPASSASPASADPAYCSLRAIYNGLTGKRDDAKAGALAALAAEPYSTEAREILAALLVPPANP